MRASKPNVKRAMERAGFVIAERRAGHVFDPPDGSFTVHGRFRNRVRVTFNADRTDDRVATMRATPDANGFMWRFTPAHLERANVEAFRVKAALVAAGFTAGVYTAKHSPVSGGEAFVDVTDGA